MTSADSQAKDSLVRSTWRKLKRDIVSSLSSQFCHERCETWWDGAVLTGLRLPLSRTLPHSSTLLDTGLYGGSGIPHSAHSTTESPQSRGFCRFRACA